MDVYLEVGKKRTYAGAVDWPGWCRSGRGEDAALQALADYGRRYARALRGTRLGFAAPKDPTALAVVARLRGDASTDFGAPGQIPAADRRPIGPVEVKRLDAVLRACWRTLDAAAAIAGSKPLRKGPRGGGRDLDKIVQHVLEADGAYLAMVGVKVRPAGNDPGEDLKQVRAAIHSALADMARGYVVKEGPRGGVRWPPRYFVRRSAWHVLDHAWEIEDRITQPT